VSTIKEWVDHSTNALGSMYMYHIQCRIPAYERNHGCNVELQCSEFLGVIRRKGAYHRRMAGPIN
jgi:hypothetical protein